MNSPLKNTDNFRIPSFISFSLEGALAAAPIELLMMYAGFMLRANGGKVNPMLHIFRARGLARRRRIQSILSDLALVSSSLQEIIDSIN